MGASRGGNAFFPSPSTQFLLHMGTGIWHLGQTKHHSAVGTAPRVRRTHTRKTEAPSHCACGSTPKFI